MAKVKLQLTNQDGNAFSILGRAQQAFKQANVPEEEIKNIMKEATSADYDNLLCTITDACDKYNIEVK